MLTLIAWAELALLTVVFLSQVTERVRRLRTYR
jgi:hypothetical protein